MEIQIRNLRKQFGTKIILDGIDLTISNGEVCCLLGTNGAGKTTFINLLIKLLSADAGTIAYEGQVYSQLPLLIKKRIGILGENNPVIEELTANQYLELTGKLYQVEPALLKKRIQDLASYFFDEEVLHKRLAGFSTGMKKKVGLMAAVLHAPDVLILDEPFSGLDPVAAQETVDFINAYRKDSRAIFLSSHDLSYVEKVATHVAVLHQRQITFSGPIRSFTTDGTTHISSALFGLLQPNGPKGKKLEWI
ncbi:ABC transporter ATP-binding protein [soil metagenome]|jgi:ABC-type multidrug transport system ATPase subunit